MSTQPVVFQTAEDWAQYPDLQKELYERIKNGVSADSGLLLSYPIVYIHYWPGEKIEYVDKKGKVCSWQKYNVYVGESNNIVSRTKEHFDASSSQANWQYHLVNDKRTPQLIIIGHPHFNKSFTLDMENRLIEYMMASTMSVQTLHNGRGNPQNEYYPVEEFDQVFHQVWKGLRKVNDQLFQSETTIEHSAIFKASPLKKLTDDQLNAKDQIIAKIYEALDGHQDGQLIFVQGEAGTGKTVLNSALFYDLVSNGEDYFGHKIKCHLMVNHDQQVTVYEQLVSRLNLGDDIVSKPTKFINNHTPADKVDVAFVDEGHLLLTQGKQAYRGHNQLADIIARAKVTVLMFDEYQILTSEEYWEPVLLDQYKRLAISQNNYIGLSHQLRMQCSPSTIKWLDDFILNKRITKFEGDTEYEVKLFDSPALLQAAIEKKAACEETHLSRIVASYDWAYNSDKKTRPENSKYWQVEIGEWTMPWNYETKSEQPKNNRRSMKSTAWAEQPHTLGEVGSTFTIQGFDLSYVGVILGPSVQFRHGEIVYDPSKSHNEKAKIRRSLSDGTKMSFGETFIRNEVKVLMTRGVKGLYIYACDDELRKALKDIACI